MSSAGISEYLGAPELDLCLRCLRGDDSRYIDGGRLFSFIAAARLSVIYTPSRINRACYGRK